MSFFRRTAHKFNQNSSFTKHFKVLGNKPKYLQKIADTTSFAPYFIVCLALPFVITPLIKKRSILQEQESGGDRRIEELRKHREERKKLKENNGNDNDVTVHSAEVEEGKEDVKVFSPKKDEDLSKQYKYILVGGGTASYAALKSIRSKDPDGTILMICKEEYSPYSRPPLTKELWKNPVSRSDLTYKDFKNETKSIFYQNEEYYKSKGIKILKGTQVTKLNVSDHSIEIENGKNIKYEKLLLATGGYPRELPGQIEFPEQITSFRNIEDFKTLENLTKTDGKIRDICIIGGSLLGTELSFALSSNTKARITQVYLEPEVLARIFPRYLSKHIGNELKQNGVKLKPNSNVIKVTKKIQDGTKENKLNLHLDTGEIVESDFVITAMGIYPNTELAEESGLEIDHRNGGIVANAELEARSGIFVAGDILSYHDVLYNKRRRSEHYLHALSTGNRAGLNMTGNTKSYTDTTLIWSESGKDSWEAIGEIDSRLDTYSVWNGASVKQNGSLWSIAPSTPSIKSLDKGVVYYLNDQKQVVGILLWNVKDKFKLAKNLILQKNIYSDLSELKNKIPINE